MRGGEVEGPGRVGKINGQREGRVERGSGRGKAGTGRGIGRERKEMRERRDKEWGRE